MWTLEGLALRLSSDAVLRALPQLRDLLRRFEAADTARVARDLDNAWHASLLCACPNRRLLELISKLKRITQRYWVVYMRDVPPIAHSAAQHGEVLEGAGGR